jgi:hypothetical protein
MQAHRARGMDVTGCAACKDYLYMTRLLQPCGAVRTVSREITDACDAALEVLFESTLITSQKLLRRSPFCRAAFFFVL